MNLLILLIILVLTPFNQSILSDNCQNDQIPQTPKKFGILTMTYQRTGMDNPMYLFNRYLNHYANLKCDLFDNLYVVWNNQQSTNQKGVQIQKQWIKNVYFMKTPYNNLGWKYVIPETAQQRVFFTVDDDLYLTCDQLRVAFQIWKNESVGELGPLVSYSKRSMNLQKNGQKFNYEVIESAMSKYYTMGLMNQAFVSRQYFDLYYSDYPQIKEMRKIVQKLKNCEDIAMNFIVSYFYSEFKPRVLKHEPIPQDKKNQIKGFNQPIPFIVGISSASDHMWKRHECVNRFTQLLSYNPLRYVSTKPTVNQGLNNSCVILKKQEYYRKTIKHKNIEQIFQNDKIFDPKLTPQEVAKLQKILAQKNSQKVQKLINKESHVSQSQTHITQNKQIPQNLQKKQQYKKSNFDLQQNKNQKISLQQDKSQSISTDSIKKQQQQESSLVSKKIINSNQFEIDADVKKNKADKTIRNNDNNQQITPSTSTLILQIAVTILSIATIILVGVVFYQKKQIQKGKKIRKQSTQSQIFNENQQIDSIEYQSSRINIQQNNSNQKKRKSIKIEQVQNN